jgi:hypothetical protein
VTLFLASVQNSWCYTLVLDAYVRGNKTDGGCCVRVLSNVSMQLCSTKVQGCPSPAGGSTAHSCDTAVVTKYPLLLRGERSGAAHVHGPRSLGTPRAGAPTKDARKRACALARGSGSGLFGAQAVSE